jgi:hypothetical protein
MRTYRPATKRRKILEQSHQIVKRNKTTKPELIVENDSTV